MTRNRTGILLIAALVVVGAIAYFVLARIDSEAKAVENGVVEFKKGNYESAAQMLSPYADQGNETAQLNVGIAYAFGQGIARNRERAHGLLQSALGSKAPEMYVWIAESFERGQEVEKDAAEALAWYRIAANEGNAQA
ncbi:MAG: tetratricopeptide repeat protein [Gammaproteobacteria bacterium]